MSETSNNVALVTLTRNFLKDRLQNDKINFHFHLEQYRTVQNLIRNTITHRESNIALISGVRGSGKTALMNSVVFSIVSNPELAENVKFIHLNGLIDTSDAIALKSIAQQLCSFDENVDKLSGSFADSLAYLLNCFKDGRKQMAQSLVFILDEIHHFCSQTNQTLLYNLFDVAQSNQAPICVIGLTCRWNLIELFEKRVKSRFSHRQIFLFPQEISFIDKLGYTKDLLKLPQQSEIDCCVDLTEFKKTNKLTWLRRIFDQKHYSKQFPVRWVRNWNSHIDEIMTNSKVIECFKTLHTYYTTLDIFKLIIFEVVNGINSPELNVDINNLQNLCSKYINNDDIISVFNDLSMLQICLLIAIKHHLEIYDYEPFNFQVILMRLNKFMKATHMEPYDTSIIFSAFEQLLSMEIISPVNRASIKVQKEFQLQQLNIGIGQINKAIAKYPKLPTDVYQWAQSSLF